MKRTFLVRLGCALLLSTTLLTACEPLNISPKGGKGGCHKPTIKDSTASGGNS